MVQVVYVVESKLLVFLRDEDCAMLLVVDGGYEDIVHLSLGE